MSSPTSPTAPANPSSSSLNDRFDRPQLGGDPPASGASANAMGLGIPAFGTGLGVPGAMGVRKVSSRRRSLRRARRGGRSCVLELCSNGTGKRDLICPARSDSDFAATLATLHGPDHFHGFLLAVLRSPSRPFAPLPAPTPTRLDPNSLLLPPTSDNNVSSRLHDLLLDVDLDLDLALALARRTPGPNEPDHGRVPPEPDGDEPVPWPEFRAGAAAGPARAWGGSWDAEGVEWRVGAWCADCGRRRRSGGEGV